MTTSTSTPSSIANRDQVGFRRVILVIGDKDLGITELIPADIPELTEDQREQSASVDSPLRSWVRVGLDFVEQYQRLKALGYMPILVLPGVELVTWYVNRYLEDPTIDERERFKQTLKAGLSEDTSQFLIQGHYASSFILTDQDQFTADALHFALSYT